IFAVLFFETEKVAHGFDGNEDAGIGSVIAVLTDLAKHADNLEANAVEQNERAHRRAAGKYVLQLFPADNRDPARFIIVSVTEPASGADRDIADLAVFGRNSKALSICGAIIADRANVFAVQDGRKILKRARLIADSQVILIGEMVGTAGLRAPFDGGNAAGEGKHNVLTQSLELPSLTAAEAFTQSDQKQQRPDAPGNAEHG